MNSQRRSTQRHNVRSILFRAIALAIACLFLVNDIAFALAPTLAAKPICEIVRKPDGSFDVVTNDSVIRSWDKETVRSVKTGESLGRAFRNRWAFVNMGYLMGQMLMLTQEHNLQDPKDILIPLIKKHISSRAGEAEILLEGFDIDGIEEVRESGEITGFSLPITRNGMLMYRLIYNLQSGDTAIHIKGGKNVYVSAEAVISKQEIDKSSIADIFPKADYLTYLIIYMTGGAMVALDKEPKEVGEALGAMHKRLDGALESEFIRRQGSPPLDALDFYLWFAQLIKNDLGTARELLSLVQYPRHKRNMAQGVPFAEGFVNGIEVLLDGSEKQVDINDTLEKILELTFSPYYRNRDYNYAISKEFSPDIPAISARQDEMAYLFFSLVLSLREMRKADLSVSTGITYDKGIKYITVTMAAAQEIPLGNVIVDKKDTGIGFELAKGIARSYGGTIDVRSESDKGTTFTVRLPLSTANSHETPVITSPGSESIHVTNLQDTIEYIQAQQQSQPLIIALGTSWIKGYEKGRYLQYDALNPLIVSLRTYCESKGIPFIVGADDNLLARINAERAKDGMSGAKVVVLAGESTAKSDEFAGLRADEKNAFVAGVNNRELTTDSYIRLLEMLTIALKLSAGLEISLDNTHIAITKDNERHIYIFLPHADPMDYERLKVIYEVQKFA